MSDDTKKQSENLTGVSNIAYDLMIVLSNKLEGIAAIEEYRQDAADTGDTDCAALFERIQRQDRESIDELRSHLLRHLQGS
ncbi:MAG: hypothetical protein AVDCRST_MAG59-3038 [uncultured Thermomicrobiales bacterium]|uniref:DUF2383 domain-containing protein n=1 Tax=uncultured Thermomicrobiales bacterium TaxID=1645740 RepID=A0A6J4V0J4_9BACT|nr:MAG: hypothetical protein AVDCRST_MAG59-3038 [uncultured Thermomicrobiales bacterium]